VSALAKVIGFRPSTDLRRAAEAMAAEHGIAVGELARRALALVVHGEAGLLTRKPGLLTDESVATADRESCGAHAGIALALLEASS
jgi:hypothetical protein